MSGLMKFVVLCCVITAALFVVAFARAGNRPHSTLDAVASEAAGRPISTWCEQSEYDWFVLLRAPADVNGFTFQSIPGWVFVSPKQCERLWLALQFGYREAGLIATVSAVFTLVHEGVHQRGITDEGVTDCTALPLVVPMLVKYFGLAPTISVPTTRVVTRARRVKIAGKWRIVKYQTVVHGTQTVSNPDYDRAGMWAQAWHRAKPAAYQGNC